MVRAPGESRRELRSELVALAPPYRTAGSLQPADGVAELSLGTIVLAKGETTIAVLAELTALSYRAPWLVPCLALPARHESLEPPLLLVTELRDRLVVVNPAGRGSDEVADVVASVRRRAAPTPTVLARWVARRLRARELEAPLRHQFEEGLGGAPADGGRSVASYSRLFSQYGRYTARDWRALARLCVHAVARTIEDGHSGASLPLRTASHYATRYLRVPYHVMTERLGWEWVLEAALRAGYLTS